MTRLNRKRLRYVAGILRQGPTEAGYAYFRARRRRRNVADEDALSESDRLVLSGEVDVEPPDLEANARLLEAYDELDELQIRSILWLLPWFHLVYGGGIYTVLRFADHFAREHGVVNRFHVYDRTTSAAARDVGRKIGAAFPALAGSELTVAGSEPPPADAAIATAWTSVYPLVRFRRTRAKFFFIQDFEPDFYPAGSASALLGEAARLGLPGIVNTPGLAEAYRALGNRAVAFAPTVDTDRYRPPEQPRAGGSVRIFFYGRPSMPRNAFGLGLATLRRVKAAHGDRVEIVCAGEDWNPGQYGMADVLTNRGMIEDVDDVARLYRACDIGLVFMLTRHPSYQPLEFMASGVATVSNRNRWTEWLLRHEETALLAPPLPALVADQIGRLVEEPDLRARLVKTGLDHVRTVHWPEQIERVWGAMTKHGDAFT